MARVLIAAGADVEAPDGSIGTPLDNAIGYGCWNVAHLLVACGARVEKPWHAAALGMLDRLEELLRADPDRGRRRWTGPLARGTLVDAASNHGTQRRNLIEWLEGLGLQRSDG